MIWLKTAVVCTILGVSWAGLGDLDFPPGFKFGAATAAYQVEGAWNVSDKSPSIWDTFTHTRLEIFNGSTGDIACDSYHLWRRDVEIAKELGLHFYRFSLSWSRLLPSGFPNRISEDGKNYYSNLIDELLKHGIEPVVTLYHWDLPQSLQDLGGWTNPLVADWFESYARVVYSIYADRVKTWITINEPIVICDVAYQSGAMAPGVVSPDVGTQLCTKHVLLAHAKAFRVFEKEFQEKYPSQVSIGNHLVWFEPYSDEDKDITDLAREFTIGRFSDPIYSSSGGWPQSLVQAMAEVSAKKGYTSSILPTFTEEEIALIKGTYHFYGFNHYTSRQIRRARPGDVNEPGLFIPFAGHLELGYQVEVGDWPLANNAWLRIYPEGIRKQLAWLKERYGDIKFFIAENGLPTLGYELEDDDRVNYYYDYLKQILLAIKEDGVDVAAYTAWTLIDNFEWVGDGFDTKFGLYEVDFESANRTRTARKSARFYQQVIEHNSLDVTIPNKMIKNDD